MTARRARIVSPERLARDYAALQARGVPVRGVRREPGGAVVYLTDEGSVTPSEAGESAPDLYEPRTPDAP